MPIRRRRNISTGDILLKKTITLTDAQIKALPTTSIELVAGPGTGKILRFIHGVATWDFTAGIYTNVGTVVAYFAYDTANNFNQASLMLAQSHDAFINQNSIQHVDFPVFTMWEAAQTRQVAISSGGTLENTNIGFTIDNSLGNFTGGNVANTMKVTVWYDIVDV